MDCAKKSQEYIDQIINTDCISGMSRLPDDSVDMVLCDLPYGITSCRWDSVIPFDQLWAQYLRVCKENAAIVLTCCQPFTTHLIKSNERMFRYCWYWNKNVPTGHAFSKKQPMRCVEDVAVFYRKAPAYNPQGLIILDKPTKNPAKHIPRSGDGVYGADKSLDKDTYTNITHYPRQLLNFSSERGLHPTQKPVALFEYFIRTYTHPGEVVLDNCIGSGTTAVACLRSRRHYVGFEIDTQHYNTTIRRINDEKEMLCRRREDGECKRL